MCIFVSAEPTFLNVEYSNLCVYISVSRAWFLKCIIFISMSVYFYQQSPLSWMYFIQIYECIFVSAEPAFLNVFIRIFVCIFVSAEPTFLKILNSNLCVYICISRAHFLECIIFKSMRVYMYRQSTLSWMQYTEIYVCVYLYQLS